MTPDLPCWHDKMLEPWCTITQQENNLNYLYYWFCSYLFCLSAPSFWWVEFWVCGTPLEERHNVPQNVKSTEIQQLHPQFFRVVLEKLQMATASVWWVKWWLICTHAPVDPLTFIHISTPLKISPSLPVCVKLYTKLYSQKLSTKLKWELVLRLFSMI